jgi:hypothetical protein
MKPRQGLFIVLVGFGIAVLSMAPICLALFASDAPPAVADTWGIGTVMLDFGIVWLLVGLAVMVAGLILAGVGVFTKEPGKSWKGSRATLSSKRCGT